MLSLKKWIQRTGNDGLDAAKLENKHVCAEHFLDSDFVSTLTGKKRLKPNSCPIDIDNVANEQTISNCIEISPHELPVDSHSVHLGNVVCHSRLDDFSVSVECCDLNVEHDVNNDEISEEEVDVEEVEEVDSLDIEFLTKKIEKLEKTKKELKDKVKLLQQKCRRQQEKSERPLNKEQILEQIEPYLNENSLILLKMQLYHSDKKKKWEQDEKYFALSLYYRSPKAYKFLRNEKKIALPCLTLMKEWVNELSLRPGLNEDMFKILNSKCKSMSPLQKECIVQLDEMSLRAFLEFYPSEDYVVGFEDLGNFGRTADQATHVLVFMLSGLFHNWKQAVYFAFSKNSVKGDILAKMILEVIDAVEKVGFKVRLVVCDQGSSNQKAASILKITHDNPFIIRNDHKIYFIFDIPHLFKCWRNNLINSDYIVGFGDDAEIISWNAIRELFDLESGKSCKAAPKLTAKHLDPNNFEKMNVKLAVQVFSASVSRAMMAGLKLNELKNENCESTANFLWIMNDIFDCLNARHPHDERVLARGLDSNDCTVENKLKNALPFIESVRMLKVSVGTNNCRRETEKYLDCFTNLALTVKSVLALWEDLKTEDKHYLLTGKLNQDPLENFFSFMRALSGSNRNPTCLQFIKNFQHAFVSTLLSPPSVTNCQPDECFNLLSSYEEVLKKDENQINAEEEKKRHELFAKVRSWIEQEFYDESLENLDNLENIYHQEIHDITENSDSESVTLHRCAKKYVAGYIAAICIKKFQCETCIQTLSRENENFENNTDMLIFWKAYRVPRKECGNLKVPSDYFFGIIEEVYDLFEKQFEIHKTDYNLSSFLTAFIEQAIYRKHQDFFDVEQCIDHRKYCIKFFVKVHIYYFLKWISHDYRDANKSNLGVDSTNKPCVKLNNLTHR